MKKRIRKAENARRRWQILQMIADCIRLAKTKKFFSLGTKTAYKWARGRSAALQRQVRGAAASQKRTNCRPPSRRQTRSYCPSSLKPHAYINCLQTFAASIQTEFLRMVDEPSIDVKHFFFCSRKRKLGRKRIVDGDDRTIEIFGPHSKICFVRFRCRSDKTSSMRVKQQIFRKRFCVRFCCLKVAHIAHKQANRGVQPQTKPCRLVADRTRMLIGVGGPSRLDCGTHRRVIEQQTVRIRLLNL